ncbi:PAP2 superfamily protein [uncultured delta proteobacterium]|uniref:PAP2 superfamily protein n=1 Tax=uncultured delta proteobacterium TaxID=34034 RepID=A0A212IVW8_9DELT|nr:PAP2 superfamily protein [uncultured delta proteobacterium]
MRTPYPFALHGLCLLPVIVLLCGMHICIGPEDAVYAYFTAVRRAHPSWTLPVEVFTDCALFLFYPAYAFFLLRGVRNKKPEDIFFAVSYLLAQVLIAALLCRVVKIAVGRPRPMTGGPLHPFSFGWGYQSFPSGHTGEIIGSTVPFLWRYGGGRFLLLPLGFGLLIAAVAFSRLYLSMHHPTDIWGGLVFGSLSGYVSWVFCNALLTRWRTLLPRRARAWLDAGTHH